MSEWSCHLSPMPEGFRSIHLMTMRKNSCGEPITVEELSLCLLCSVGQISVGTIATRLGNLKAMWVIGFWDCRGQKVAFSHQRQEECGDHRG